MDSRQLIGISKNNPNHTSGLKNSHGEVETWARKELANKPHLDSVIVCEAIGVIERQDSPILYRELKNAPGVADRSDTAEEQTAEAAE
jgi:hypothetical protein